MPVAHDASAAYSGSRSDAKAMPIGRAPWPDSGRHADPDSTQEFTRVTDEPGVGTGLRVGPGPTYGRGSLPGRHLAERGPEGGYPAQGTRASGPQQAIGPGSGP